MLEIKLSHEVERNSQFAQMLCGFPHIEGTHQSEIWNCHKIPFPFE